MADDRYATIVFMKTSLSFLVNHLDNDVFERAGNIALTIDVIEDVRQHAFYLKIGQIFVCFGRYTIMKTSRFVILDVG